MNERSNPADPDSAPMSDALRWQLRALRKDVEPPPDLWSRIEPRLAAPPEARRQPRVAFAIAAGLVMAVGSLFLIQRQPSSADAAGADAAATVEGQYRIALETLPSRPGAELAPTIEELDRSTRQIRSALKRDPDSPLLLEQLRRTYAIRLALHQRATVG